MRTRQNERLAAESTADRDPRKQQMSASQRERLAAETTAEREARLQQMSARGETEDYSRQGPISMQS